MTIATHHAWDKLAPHRYRCTKCGLERHHVQAPRSDDPHAHRGWVAAFLRDGVPIAQGRTPPCPGAPLPEMVWTRGSDYHWIAATGHRISAARTASGLRYSAWRPELSDGRIHLLGVYPQPDAARTACARDAQAQAQARRGTP